MKNNIIFWKDYNIGENLAGTDLWIDGYEKVSISMPNTTGNNGYYALYGPMPGRGYIMDGKLKSDNMDDAKKEVLNIYKDGLIKSMESTKKYIQYCEKVINVLNEMEM